MKYKIGQPIKWHKATWDGTPNPVAGAAFDSFILEKKHFGRGRDFCLFLSKGKIFWAGYDMDNLYVFGKYLVRQWLKNSKKFKKIKENNDATSKNLEEICHQINVLNLEGIRFNKLIILYHQLYWAWTKYLSWSSFTEPATVYLQPIIDQLFDKYIPEKTSSLRQQILTSEFPSFLQEKNIAELKLAAEILKNKQWPAIFKKKGKLKDIKDNPILFKKFEKIQSQYFWIKNSYAQAIFLPIDFFVEEVGNILKESKFCLEKIYRERAKIKKPAKEKNSLLRKLKFSLADRKIFDLMDRIGYLQDSRKALLMEGIEYFDRIFHELGRRTKLNIDIFRFLMPQEILSLKEDSNFKKSAKLGEQRFKGCALIYQDGKITMKLDKSTIKKIRQWLIEVKNKDKEIKGTVACPGPIIRGTARVILSATQVGKVRKGEILVAPNTTPDYLLAMKQANAILTEKGGLTSHAAIVSRELKKPCIVGILNLTSLIKDGDLVEVDAGKGIVKKLKKV